MQARFFVSDERFTVGASLLAKGVKDNAQILRARGVLKLFASKLAPTVSRQSGRQNATEVCTYTVRGSPTYFPLLLSSNERV